MTSGHRVVLTNREHRVLDVEPSQTILEAAEADGVTLPYGCRYGGCITCAARLVSGTVDQPNAVGLKDYMRQAGYILTCVSHPRTDCELEVGVSSHFAGLYRNPFRSRARVQIDRSAESPSMAPSVVSDQNLDVTNHPLEVVAHYGRHEALVSDILAGLSAAGYDIDSLDPAALSGADEFHLGGRLATLAVLDAVRADAPTYVLDVGCGIGGPARTIATELGARTVGIDLTPAFVAAATELTARVGLSDRVSFRVGNALALDEPDEQFDLVTLFHVGMNIGNKRKLFTELARVLRPGGRVLVYDIMRIAPGTVSLPMPWASSDDHDHLANVDDYLSALDAAGLDPAEPVDHRPTVRTALEHAADAPPPVNLSNLMGPDFDEMFANLRAAMAAAVIAPTQLVATKPV